MRPLQNALFQSLRLSAQSQRQARILVLEIFDIFLWLKSSPSLTLTKIEHFSKVSEHCYSNTTGGSGPPDLQTSGSCLVNTHYAGAFSPVRGPVFDREKLFIIIEPAECLQSVNYQLPGAINILTYFALAIF